jgi:hypothetical protein
MVEHDVAPVPGVVGAFYQVNLTSRYKKAVRRVPFDAAVHKVPGYNA